VTATAAPRSKDVVGMRRLSVVLSLLASFLVSFVLAGPVAQADTVPLPGSIAAAGDSITRAYDATLFGCFLADCTQYSWSTGGSTSVASQYRRILAKNAAISGHAYNDAKTGAKMDALPAQLQTAGATQGAQYVTVLMGANDLCTSSAATMTATSTFQSTFQQALDAYFTAAPTGHVFVSSIPNLYQLWSLLHTNSSAASTWKTFGICQSMLASTNTEAERQQVVTREREFNAALQQVCEAKVNCRWDQGATYGYTFVKSDVSTVDYFHPSISGQNHLAGVTWTAGYWPTM
jgi:lysophospholipase L1-like esterase